ncbi:nucleotide pyrophosphohydrolase [Staphylococcus hyicus]|uniref:MazG nucleotide pyrophosphohydrolase domain-containing protein n=1 Tax=Staphylococcus hyicus TaxID=1284 RepID=UPI000580A87F|nr:MazG nucleotide pyrophosphohydrolase domain-containing protein [Staphylococcus hyicus]AJC96953.1 tetrapyrrole methyltransferase/nucleoside triphosphate pyrophosphohydrolase [Staphylococcus hyicus]MCE5154989.1 nucleotide pyrophosphohydrolase [Staphylococcus hyicus]MCQ9301900.1 SAM-dependent methyltransferase [Staphylococcus hyicus]RTX69483.1 nucleotide pyrophosphohydrolase [Staphylococcus hyicus]SQE48972.1 tetrapyrrole (corrin/porphyrin) methylase [Staphylococcus hyicus]
MTHHITIIGLGNYGLDDLPLGIYRFLQSQSKVYVRTIDHPVIAELQDIDIVSFDAVYEQYDSFEPVYEAITDQLLQHARTEDIVYAVPGHPRVAETTTQLLFQKAPQFDVVVDVRGGRSFIDDVFEAVKLDPNDGFTMLDATALKKETLNPRTTTLVTQVYSAMVAGDLKLTLMTRYPDDFEVHIVDGANQSGATRYTCPLYELDHEDVFTNLTSVIIPAITEDTALYGDFEFADQVIASLVDDETGCPWDKVQTHTSLKRYLLEETFELFEAIDNEDDWHMIEELGDILLQVLLHANIGQKQGYMETREIVASLSEKMIRRHPHIFGEGEADSVEDVKSIWQEQKAAEGKPPRVKFEKIFATHFLKLYDEIKNQDLSEEALKAYLERGGHHETR